MSRMRITWIGGATSILEMGAFRILVDPVFRSEFSLGSADVARTCALPPFDLSGVTLVALTCARTDHYDPELASRAGADVPLVVPEHARECLEACGHNQVREIAWEQSTEFQIDGATLVVTAVAAASANGDDNGYFLSLRDGGEKPATAYITGDALFTDDVRSAQKNLGYANLLVPYLGAERTAGGEAASAGADDAMQFVYRMQPNAIVPVHHHTFSHYTGTVDAFAQALSRTIYDRRLHVLAEGASFER